MEKNTRQEAIEFRKRYEEVRRVARVVGVNKLSLSQKVILQKGDYYLNV